MHETITLCAGRALLGAEMSLSDGPVDIVIAGNRIREVRPAGVRPAEGTEIELRGRLVAPGMINGHIHSHEHYHKGRYDNVPLELWMNYVRPARPMPLTARQVYLRTMIGAIEVLRGGGTTLCDDMNVAPVLREDHVEAALQAYEDIGIRAHLGITLFDKPFFRGMPFVDEELPRSLIEALSPSVDTTPPGEILAYVRRLAGVRHPRQCRVGVIAAPSAPQRCTEPFLVAVRHLADEYDLPLMIHCQETRLQVVTGHVLYGSTMVEYLDRIGFLKPKTALIHGVWLNPREIDTLAERGVSVQHNPTCNMKMGSGLAPVHALMEGGVNVSLATDGCGSIETASMLKAVMSAALANKLRTADHGQWFGAHEAWRAATLGGARALGRDDELGLIAPGYLADLVAYRLDRIPFVPLNDAVRQLVYAETGAGIDFIMTDGRVVMRQGELTGISEAALLDEIQESYLALIPHIEEGERMANQLIDPYKRICARCEAMPIAADTHAGRMS